MLVISPSAQISKLADIEDSVRGTRITIGDGVFIDSFVKLRVAGGMGDVTIGANCYINAGSVLYSGNGITLGEYVLIAANCTLAPTNHEYRDPDTVIRLQGFAPSRGGIVVEDDVWIGANSVLLDGARIGRGAVVAAGSVVRGALPAYSISAGNPAKVVKWRKKAAQSD
jgi:virginiamycin A acetyltransferase